MTTTDTASRRALIIGTSRGLGLAIAEQYLRRGWSVVGTVRGTNTTPLHDLRASWPGRLEIASVDINVPIEIDALRASLDGTSFDLLFVNAGVKNDDRETIADVSTDEFVRVMVTNALGPLRAIERLRDLVREDGVIGVMSSGQGSVANNTSGGYEVYRASKAALNTLMRSYAARHKDDAGKTLLLLAPGWIRTDMGGAAAPFGIDETIPVLVDTIERERGTPGLRYITRTGEIVPW